jgi:type I site-specific restriction-modification system R (restriction) subunit
VAVSSNFNNAQFDEYGNISNYTDLMAGITEEFNNAQTTFNNSSQSEADKEALENAEKLYEKKVKILETYEETLNKQKEQEQILQDLENQLQDLNYEKLTYKLELEMIVNDDEMKELDYYFGKMEGDIEKAVEAFGILQDKLDVTSEKLFDYKDHFNSLE